MAGHYDFTIEQGVTFSRTVTWKSENNVAVDLTGKTARMEIRTRDGELIKDVPITVTGAVAGELTFSLTSIETEELDFDSAVYDIEISQGSEVVKRLLKGTVTLDREVTEDE